MALATLADGTEVHCLRRSEALVLDHHVRGYLAHGIEVRDGDTVFDVGANIGLFGVRAMQMHPTARVFAFEPVPAIFAILEANAARFGAGRFIPLNMGLAAAPGRTRFTYYPNSPALSTAHPEMWDADPGTLERAVAGNVRAAREAVWYARLVPAFLSGFIARHLRTGAIEVDAALSTVSAVMRAQGVERIDLLKVDCEGGELAVLQGVDEADWPRIGQVVTEVHDADGRLDTVRALLVRAGISDISVEKEAGFEETRLVNVFARRPGAR